MNVGIYNGRVAQGFEYERDNDYHIEMRFVKMSIIVFWLVGVGVKCVSGVKT